MKKIFTLFLCLFISGVFAQTSSIFVQSTDKTTTINIGGKSNIPAGTFKGTRDGSTINFYCIDFNHNLEYSEYVPAGETDMKIGYVLNNYYPFKAYPYTGSLSTTNKEAAAIQVALWYLSDGIDYNTCSNTEIKNRAKAIIDDANANATPLFKTLVINIPPQDFKIGKPVKFLVEAYNQYNTPVANLTIDLTTDHGTLSNYHPVTNSTGITDTIFLTQENGVDFANISAEAEVFVRQGTRFVHKTKPSEKQQLVLATPFKDKIKINANVKWFGEADLSLVKIGKVLTVSDGDNVTYEITVSNSATATAAANNVQVSDVLAKALTFISSDGDYNPATGVWNVGTIGIGQSKTLKITCKVTLANNGGMYDLGPAKPFNLFVINDLNQPSADTEGKVAVGHDAVLAGYSVGDKLPANSGDVLIVGRKLTYKTGRVYNGNVVYGEFIDTTHANLAYEGTIRKESGLIDFAAADVYLQNLSKNLFTLAPNGTVENDGYRQLTLTGTDPKLNIFEVTDALAANVNHIKIVVPQNALVLVNYVGSNITLTGGFEVNGVGVAPNNTDPELRAAGSKVLFNFYKATDIKIYAMGFYGSILAPKANLDFGTNMGFGVVYGQVIVKNMNGAGQFNLCPYEGEIKVDTTITNVAAIISYNNAQSMIQESKGKNFDFFQISAKMDPTDVKESDVLPVNYDLKQNYPNPFNPSTTIEVAIAQKGSYKLTVFNLLGKEVAQLSAGNLERGTHKFQFNAANLSSGIYFYRLTGNNLSITKKMILMK